MGEFAKRFALNKKNDDAVDAPGVMGRTKDMSTYVRE